MVLREMELEKEIKFDREENNIFSSKGKEKIKIWKNIAQQKMR